MKGAHADCEIVEAQLRAEIVRLRAALEREIVWAKAERAGRKQVQAELDKVRIALNQSAPTHGDKP